MLPALNKLNKGQERWSACRFLQNLNTQRNYFCQLLNVHGVTDVWQTEVCTDEPLMPKTIAFTVENVIKKFKRYKSSCSYQISMEMMQARGRTLLPDIHKYINFVWNKEELPQWFKESINLPICKKGDKVECSNYQCTSFVPATCKILFNILQSRLTPHIDKITGDHKCGIKYKTSMIICSAANIS